MEHRSLNFLTFLSLLVCPRRSPTSLQIRKNGTATVTYFCELQPIEPYYGLLRVLNSPATAVPKKGLEGTPMQATLKHFDQGWRVVELPQAGPPESRIPPSSSTPDSNADTSNVGQSPEGTPNSSYEYVTLIGQWKGPLPGGKEIGVLTMLPNGSWTFQSDTDASPSPPRRWSMSRNIISWSTVSGTVSEPLSSINDTEFTSHIDYTPAHTYERVSK